MCGKPGVMLTDLHPYKFRWIECWNVMNMHAAVVLVQKCLS